MKCLRLLFILIPVFACKNSREAAKNITTNHATTKNPAGGTVYPTEPGTCIIQAYLIQQAEPLFDNQSCKANGIVTQVRSCGFGINQKPAAGDTLLFLFNNLEKNNTWPCNKAPAKEHLFESQVKIKERPGNVITYEIYSYEIMH